MFDQYAEISCQRNSENVTSKIQDIINRARLEIQEVVKTAVRNICDIQQQHTSFSDLLGSLSPSGEKCVTQEDNCDHAIGCPSDDHFCSWEPRNIHVTYINSSLNWMPDESAGNHAQQREVAWQRRRRKFHSYMHEAKENA